MLSYLRTSLFESNAQTVVNTVNTVGIMGKGLAAEFRKRYPEMFDRYREICSNQLLDVGKLWLWKGPSQWVLNFPTKQHWRQPSKIEYIQSGLEKFVVSFEDRGITEISFPRLGCGNGGLGWDEVRPLMEEYLRPLPIPIYIHDYEVELGLPEHTEIVTSRLRENTFDEFWSDLKLIVAKDAGEFKTIANNSKFTANILPEALQITRGDGREVSIPRSEIFQAWQVLNRGILTRKRLEGRSFSEAYYLIPVLANIPYLRPVQIEKKGEAPMIGLEMTRRTGIQSEDAGQPAIGSS